VMRVHTGHHLPHRIWTTSYGYKMCTPGWRDGWMDGQMPLEPFYNLSFQQS
jgi:hypothetical protein